MSTCVDYIADLSNDVWVLTKNLQSQQSENASLKYENKELRAELDDLRMRVTALEADVRSKDQQLKQKEDELERTDAEVEWGPWGSAGRERGGGGVGRENDPWVGGKGGAREEREGGGGCEGQRLHFTMQVQSSSFAPYSAVGILYTD